MLLKGLLGKLLVFATLFFASVAATAAAAPDVGGQLYPIKQGGLFGFIDASGQMIIQPQFAAIRPFSEGFAAVRTADGNWGYIDQSGKLAVPSQFKQADSFSEGLAAVSFDFSNVGYIDKSGKLVIPVAYDLGNPFHNGLASVKQNGKYCFIDRNGQVSFRTEFGDVWRTSSELIAFVTDDAVMGFMDWQGRVVIKPVYHRVVNWRGSLFNEAIAPVSKGPFGKGAKWGFIDQTGKTVIDFIYDWAEQFSEGMAVVGKDDHYGYINAQGELAIPQQFEGAENFSEGLAAVMLNGRWGFIDKRGTLVIKAQYLSLRWGSPIGFHEGLARVRTETGIGFINKTGEIVVAPTLRAARDFSDGLAEVELNGGLSGYINQHGELVWPPTR